MKKLLAIVLCLTMLCAAFAGCSKEPSLVGSWTGTCDFMEILGTFSEYYSGKLEVEVTYVFNEDGTYEMSFDGYENIEDGLKIIVENMVEAMAAEEDMDYLDIETYMEELDLDWDSLMEQCGLDESLLSSRTGKYKLEGERLYMSQGYGDIPEETTESIRFIDKNTIEYADSTLESFKLVLYRK